MDLSLFSASVLLFVIAFLIDGALLALCIATYWGMRDLKDIGYKLNTILMPVETLIMALSFFLQTGEVIYSGLYLILGCLVWWLPNAIYFKKRRSLFGPAVAAEMSYYSGGGYAAPQAEYLSNSGGYAATQPEYLSNSGSYSAPQAEYLNKYCPQCGEMSQDAGSRYCRNCGASLSSQDYTEPDPFGRAGQATMAQTAVKPKKKIIGFIIAGAVIVAIIAGLGIYSIVNYNKAVEAAEAGKYVLASQYMDKILFVEAIMPDEYAYAKAAALVENGDFIGALQAFKSIEDGGYALPSGLLDSIKEQIYYEGQSAYYEGNNSAAKSSFNAIGNYERSADYLTLIAAKESEGESVAYADVLTLLGFEDATQMILSYYAYQYAYLAGNWSTASPDEYLYFNMNKDDYYTEYTLPYLEVEGYYYIIDGVYCVEDASGEYISVFEFSIIDENTMSVYCYQDGSVYTLYRQW